MDSCSKFVEVGNFFVNGVDVLGELLIRHEFEQIGSEGWFLVEIIDLVSDHLTIFIVQSHLDLERPNDLLVKFGELVDVARSKTCNVAVSVLGRKRLVVLDIKSHGGKLISDALVIEFSLRVLRSELVDLLLVHLELLVGLVRG